MRNFARLGAVILFLFSLCAGTSVSAQRIPGPGGSKPASGGGATAFTYVASSVTGCWVGSTATTCSYNLHVNPTAGHLGIVSAEWQSSTATASFACTNNGTWTPIGSPTTGINGNSAFTGQMFYAPAMAAGAGPENCTLTISASVVFLSWEYLEYSYTGTLSAPDGTPKYSTTPASGNVATISGVTTTGSSDLVFVACLGVTDTCQVGSGFTARNDANSCHDGFGGGNCGGGSTGVDYNGTIGSLLEEKVNVAAGAQTATFATTGATDDVILGLVAF